MIKFSLLLIFGILSEVILTETISFSSKNNTDNAEFQKKINELVQQINNLKQYLHYKVLRKGDSETFYEKLDILKIKLIGYNKDMIEYYRTKNPIFVKLHTREIEKGYQDVFECIRLILPLMSYNEKARIFCPHDLANREYPVSDTLGPFSNLYFDIEVVGIFDEFDNVKSATLRKNIKANSIKFTSKDQIFSFFNVTYIKLNNDSTYYDIIPSYGDDLSFHFTGRINKSKRIYEKTNPENPITYKLGTSTPYILKCHEHILPFLRIGDKIKFNCPNEYAFSDRHFNRLIKPYTDLEFDFELTNITKSDYDYSKLDSKEGVFKAFDLVIMTPGDNSTCIEIGDYIFYSFSVYISNKERNYKKNIQIDENAEKKTHKVVFQPNVLIKCHEYVFPYLCMNTRVKFYCPSVFALGESYISEKLEANSDIYFDLEINQIRKKKAEL